MSDTREIEVLGMFGSPIRMTKERFVDRWRSHAVDFYNLGPSLSYDDAEKIIEMVTDAAQAEFERLAKEQGAS